MEEDDLRESGWRDVCLREDLESKDATQVKDKTGNDAREEER